MTGLELLALFGIKRANFPSRSHPTRRAPYRISPIYLSGSRAMLFSSYQALKEPTMEWTAPKHEEIDLNCEISSYANAEL